MSNRKRICSNCKGRFYDNKTKECPFCNTKIITDDILSFRKFWNINPKTKVKKSKRTYRRSREKNNLRKEVNNE